MTVFVGNTNVLELVGLRNEVTAAYVNDADVTVTVVDLASDEVPGAAWPLTMEYVEDSDGIYRVTLAADLAFTARKTYRAMIDVDAGEDVTGHWEYRFKPLTRTD